MTRARAAQLLLDRGWLLSAVVLVAYVWLAPQHIVDGDNAELTTVAATGGIAHPSGYPLYLLWLRATSWLPGVSPAHTASIATAILGAASILVLHAACRAWGARPLAATIACAIFAASPVVLRINTEAEVFAMNGLVVATVLWLAARAGPLRGVWRAAALGLVAGLGLSNHLTCVLVAPVGLYGVVRATREARPWVIGAAVGGLVIGLLPYAYLLLAPETPASWGTVGDLGELYAFITREAYGGPGAFLARGEQAPVTVSLGVFVETLGRTWLWAPLVLGLATLAYCCVRPGAAGEGAPVGETRIGWSMLAASWVLAGPVLASRFNTPPDGIGLYIAQRFHVLPALVLAIPVAVGLGALASRISARVRAWERPAAAIAATLGFAALAGLSLGHVQRLHTPAVERSAQNLLQMLPPDAVMIAFTDELCFGASYVQWALGARQDVVVVAWGTMALPWYRERMARRGILGEPVDGPPIVQVATHLLAGDRPLFVDPIAAGAVELLRAFPSYPYGPLVRVLPRGTAPPPLDEVLAKNQAIYAAFQLDYPRPGPDDEWATVIHQRYAATWHVLARALAAAGRADDARLAQELAATLGPRPRGD